MNSVLFTPADFVRMVSVPGFRTLAGKANQTKFELTPENVDTFLSSRQGENTFFGAGIDPSAKLMNGRALDSDIRKLRCIPFDFDVRNHVITSEAQRRLSGTPLKGKERADTLKKLEDEIRAEGTISDEEIKEFGRSLPKLFANHPILKRISVILFSGNGIHMYLTGAPIEIQKEMWEEGCAELYEAADALSAFPCDHSVKNPSRIMRLFGSNNCKRGLAVPMECLFYNPDAQDAVCEIPDLANERLEKIAIAEIFAQDTTTVTTAIAPATANQDRTTNDAIAAIPVQDVLKIATPQYSFRGKRAYENINGKMEERGFFLSTKGNFIVPGGSHVFASGIAKGYGPFALVKFLFGLENKEVYEWFREHFQSVREISDREREQWTKEKKEPKKKGKKNSDDDEDEPLIDRETMLEQLTASAEMKRILPFQAFEDGIAYMTVILNRKNELKPHIVTSTRDCFPCCEKELIHRGFGIFRAPSTIPVIRWDQQSVLHFLNSETEIQPLSVIYEKIYASLQTYLDFADPRTASMLTLWIMGTFVYRLFPAFPYLYFTGTRGSGKTKTLDILSLLSFNGMHSSCRSSAAGLLRLVDGDGATLCLDEAEKLWDQRDEQSGYIQDLLRLGYKDGTGVIKCEDSSSGPRPRLFDPYSPKAISGIEGVENALYSRCIETVTLASVKTDVADREVVLRSSEWSELRAMIYPAMLMATAGIDKILSGSTAEFAEGLSSRARELWKPLLCVASAISNEMYDQTLSFAIEVQNERAQEEHDVDTLKVLSCLKELLGSKEADWIATDAMHSAIAADDDAFAWLLDAKNTRSRGRWLSRHIKHLKLSDCRAQPRATGLDGKKQRCYHIIASNIEKALERMKMSVHTWKPEDVETEEQTAEESHGVDPIGNLDGT
jgi:hypothetical protein